MIVPLKKQCFETWFSFPQFTLQCFSLSRRWHGLAVPQAVFATCMTIIRLRALQSDGLKTWDSRGTFVTWWFMVLTLPKTNTSRMKIDASKMRIHVLWKWSFWNVDFPGWTCYLVVSNYSLSNWGSELYKRDTHPGCLLDSWANKPITTRALEDLWRTRDAWWLGAPHRNFIKFRRAGSKDVEDYWSNTDYSF